MIAHKKIFLCAVLFFGSIALAQQGNILPESLDASVPGNEPYQVHGSDSFKQVFGEKMALLPQNPLSALPISVMPYGFVKTDYYWDSRQVLGYREEQALLWPLARQLDPCGKDINAHPEFQFTSIQTRVGFLIKGPNIGRKKRVAATALIETDFFGLNELIVNQLRLRHGFFKLDFLDYDMDLIFGQFWHPLFQPDCFIRDLSFNYGVPFDAAARQPQIRYTKNFSWGSFIIAALSQRDFQSFGTLGFDSSYVRNAKVPDFCLDLRYYLPNDNFIGATFDAKRLAPRIVSSSGYAVKEYVYSFIGQGYASISFDNLTMNFKGLYAQNATDFWMLGGYAVKSVAPITDCRTYAPVSCFSLWTDSFYVSDYGQTRFQLEYGLFVGGTKNLGSRSALYIDPTLGTPIIYSIDPTAAYVWRVSPRLLFKKYPLRFGIELITTGAAFGKIDDHARVNDAVPVTDFRFLFVAYYVF